MTRNNLSSYCLRKSQEDNMELIDPERMHFCEIQCLSAKQNSKMLCCLTRALGTEKRQKTPRLNVHMPKEISS